MTEVAETGGRDSEHGEISGDELPAAVPLMATVPPGMGTGGVMSPAGNVGGSSVLPLAADAAAVRDDEEKDDTTVQDR